MLSRWLWIFGFTSLMSISLLIRLPPLLSTLNIFVINNIKYEWKYSQSNLDPTNFLHPELDFIFLVNKVTSHPIPTILRATNKTVSWRVGTFERFQKIHRKLSNRKRLPVLYHTWTQESLRLLKRITKAIRTDARWKKEKKKERYGKERVTSRETVRTTPFIVRPLRPKNH